MPFQYFVLRCMPRVDRGEFVNVGVVIFCQTAEYLDAHIHLPVERVTALDDDLDLAALRAALSNIEAICRGDEECRRSGNWRSRQAFRLARSASEHGASARSSARRIDGRSGSRTHAPRRIPNFTRGPRPADWAGRDL